MSYYHKLYPILGDHLPPLNFSSAEISKLIDIRDPSVKSCTSSVFLQIKEDDKQIKCPQSVALDQVFQQIH